MQLVISSNIPPFNTKMLPGIAFLSSQALYRSTFTRRLSSVVTPIKPSIQVISTHPHPTANRKRVKVVSKLSPPSESTATNSIFRLAPSDFAFLWQECRRCFYLKAHKKLYRPRAPFPSIFGTIDTGMKNHFRGLRTDQIFPKMPPGTFLCEEKDAWVESAPITPPGCNASVYVRGMIDCLVRFDDETFGVIDFKTSSTKNTASTYARQLHAYALAMENPSQNSELEQGKVSDMALIVYTPSTFHTPTSESGDFAAALAGNLSYVGIPRDDTSFSNFLVDIVNVLTADEAPPPPPPNRKWGSGSFSSCPYCQFLHDAKQHGFIPDEW